MSKPASDTKLAYRAYFWMMDLCLIAGILILLSFLPIIEFVVDSSGEIPTWYLVYGYLLLFVSFILAPSLMLARFMRDEYAEQLFRRTTIVLIYVAVAVPWAIFVVATIVYIANPTDKAPYPFNLFMGEVTWWSAAASLFKYFCLAFVFVFQFLRWRDGR